MSKICAIHQPHYLPYMGYFDKMFRSDVFVFHDTTQFVRGEWQNRNKIRTASGDRWLTIPVRSKGQYQRLCDAKIDVTQTSWKRDHLQLIKLNYSKAKYFDKFWGPLKRLYAVETENLAVFNMHLVNFFKSVLIPEWSGDLKIASSYKGLSDEPTKRLIDICRKFDCDTYLAGSGGADYMNIDTFTEAEIVVVWQEFKEKEHEQCYKPFRPGMGCLDYLLNCGRWK